MPYPKLTYRPCIPVLSPNMEIRFPPPWSPAEPPKSLEKAIRDFYAKAGYYLAGETDLEVAFKNNVGVMCGWLGSAIEDAQYCKLGTTIEDIHVVSQAHRAINDKLRRLRDELSEDALEQLGEAAMEVWDAGKEEVVKILITKCKCQTTVG